jgi:hypothetical protein
MVCKDEADNVHAVTLHLSTMRRLTNLITCYKVIVKDLGYRRSEQPCDPDELVVEPREAFLHEKLTTIQDDTPSLIKLVSKSYQHSARRYPVKLCELSTLPTSS